MDMNTEIHVVVRELIVREHNYTVKELIEMNQLPQTFAEPDSDVNALEYWLTDVGLSVDVAYDLEQYEIVHKTWAIAPLAFRPVEDWD